MINMRIGFNHYNRDKVGEYFLAFRDGSIVNLTASQEKELQEWKSDKA